MFWSTKGSIVVGIDYDCRERMVYWTDVAGRTISRASLEPGAEPETIINSGQQLYPEDTVFHLTLLVQKKKPQCHTSCFTEWYRTSPSVNTYSYARNEKVILTLSLLRNRAPNRKGSQWELRVATAAAAYAWCHRASGCISLEENKRWQNKFLC